MEFKYRAVDQRPRTNLPPYTWTVSSSQTALLGSFSKGDPTSWTRSSLMSIPPYEVETIQRELEKQQIRRDIIASEIARRQILEAEVKMELMMEREMTTRRAAAQGFPSNNQFTMSPQMYPFDYGPLKQLPPFSHPTVFNRSSLPPHQLPSPLQPCALPSEIRPHTVANKDKLIVLARPNPEISCQKRKAVTHPAAVDSEAAQFGLKRKPREEWSCALCHVSASSEKTLNAHIQGKKHKSKAHGLTAHANMLPLKGSEREETVTTNRSENLDLGTDSFHLKKNPRKEWGCALCQVNTTGKMRYNEHVCGRKHRAKEKRLRAHTNSNTIIMPGESEISSEKNEETVATNGSEILSGGESFLPKEKKDIKGDSNKQSRAVITQVVDFKNEAKRKEKLEFWCETCRVGAHSLKVMESHKLGRKHLTRMKHASPCSKTSSEVMQGAADFGGNEKAICHKC